MSKYLKKTYAVGLVTIAYGLIVHGWQQGDWDTASKMVLVGLAMITGRHAIQKLEM